MAESVHFRSFDPFLNDGVKKEETKNMWTDWKVLKIPSVATWLGLGRAHGFSLSCSHSAPANHRTQQNATQRRSSLTSNTSARQNTAILFHNDSIYAPFTAVECRAHNALHISFHVAIREQMWLQWSRDARTRPRQGPHLTLKSSKWFGEPD